MPIDIKQFELDRVVNMLRAFGWTVVRSEFQGDKIVISMEKIVTPEVSPGS